MKWPKSKQIGNRKGQGSGGQGLRKAHTQCDGGGTPLQRVHEGQAAENVNVVAENPPTMEAQPQPDVRVCLHV